MSPASEARPNPYVGPRAFRYGERLYGRDREVLELLDLLIAERIVLLYSPSGAGKTSLIQAALVPELEDREDFTVPPVARVGLLAPANSEMATANRYVLSVLLSLEGDLDEPEQLPMGELSRMELADYIEHRPEIADPAGGVALVFDQFEEVLTLDPTDMPEKEAFFAQLGAILRSQDRWALFAMREEHVAGLDPYRRFLPTRLDNTYRLELLDHEQGKLAMQRPAKAAGVDFTDAAARKLVDDLRRVRVQQQDGTVTEQPGPFIEPVHLQVICQNLWGALDDDVEIGEDDVEAHGDVDKVLADYYAEQIAWVARETGTGEAVLRHWVQDQMITAQGLRTQILQEDAKQSRGMDNKVVRALVNAHLLREERRRGLIWFELAHDRLVEPIRKNNDDWLQANLSVLQRQAMLWHGQGRPQHLELRGQELAKAIRWAATHPGEMTSVEHDFLTACLKRRTEERRLRRLRTVIYISLMALPVGIIIAAFYANALQNQPWARTTNLWDGSVYYLSMDKVSIGRSTDVISADISSTSRLVSRIHMYITDRSIAVDMRSRNGSTKNARIIPYGRETQLVDQDLIALGGVELYRFNTIEHSWFPFLRSEPSHMRRDDTVWGIFVDEKSRTAIPLIKSHYYLKMDSGNNFLIGTEDTAGVLVEFGLTPTLEAWIEDAVDGPDLLVKFKKNDYEYEELRLEFGAHLIIASGSYRYSADRFQIVLSRNVRNIRNVQQ